MTPKELRKFNNIAKHHGTYRHNRFASVRNCLRKLGCPEPEATRIARSACGKNTPGGRAAKGGGA